jgi:hypothetical protein
MVTLAEDLPSQKVFHVIDETLLREGYLARAAIA